MALLGFDIQEAASRGVLARSEILVLRTGSLLVGKTKDEHGAHATLLALEHFRLEFELTLPRSLLVKELVAVVARPPGDLPRSGDLEPLDRRLVCFQLWHGSSFLSLQGAVRAP